MTEDKQKKPFKVICDDSNNTPEALAKGEVVVTVVLYDSMLIEAYTRGRRVSTRK